MEILNCVSIKRKTLNFHAAITSHFQKQLYQSSPNKWLWSTYYICEVLCQVVGHYQRQVLRPALQTCVSNSLLSSSSGRSNWYTKLSVFRVKLLMPLDKMTPSPGLLILKVSPVFHLLKTKFWSPLYWICRERSAKYQLHLQNNEGLPSSLYFHSQHPSPKHDFP